LAGFFGDVKVALKIQFRQEAGFMNSANGLNTHDLEREVSVLLTARF
jgi:hypothetical protein